MMNADVKILLELQELDRELLAARQALAKYPSAWEATKSRVFKARELAEVSVGEHKKHLEERLRIDRELREQTDFLRRSQLQQTMVKSQKEYTAITTQIDAVKERIMALEREGIAELEREEALKAEIERTKKEATDAEAFARQEKERFRGLIDEKKSQIATAEKSRESLVSRMEPKSRTIYERVAKRHPGTFVVPVRGGSCTGCNFRLLQGALIELHRSQTVHCCDNCGRVLSHDEEFQPENAQQQAG